MGERRRGHNFLSYGGDLEGAHITCRSELTPVDSSSSEGARKCSLCAGCPCAQLGLEGVVTKGRRGPGCGRQPAESACPLIRLLPSLSTSDIIHKFIRDKYSKRFPELESLVPNALDYIRTVKVSEGQGARGEQAPRPHQCEGEAESHS